MNIKINGAIKKVIYSKIQNNIYDDDQDEKAKKRTKVYFTILVVFDENNNEYKVKGNSLMNPEINDILSCNCIKEKDDHISMGFLDISLPTKSKDVVERLMSNKMKIDGIGMKTIENFVNKYGYNVWNVQKGDNIYENKIIAKIKEYINTKSKNQECEIVQHISNFISYTFDISLTPTEVDNMKDLFTDKKIEYPLTNKTIKNNILNLIEILSLEKLKKICDVIKMNTSTQRRMLILYSIHKSRNYEGNSCLPKSNFDKDYLEEISYLVNNKYIHEYHNCLYLYKDYIKEKHIAQMMFDYKNSFSNIDKVDDNEINNDPSVKKLKLNTEQKNGVINAFNNIFSIITGFPGVGKTTTVKSIKNICTKIKENIVVIAPTGKVVLKIINDFNDFENRDFEQVYTIHKFVGFLRTIQSDKYKKSGEKNLSHIEHIDILVIDELSMVTNDLFHELLNKLKSCEHLPRIVFIGDVDQLPAIGIGYVLHSLINCNKFPVSRLITPMRNSGELYDNILKIRENNKPKFNNNNFKYITNKSLEHCNTLLHDELNILLDNFEFSDIMLITPTNSNIKYFSNNVRKLVNKNYDNENNDNKNNNDDFYIKDFIMMKVNCYVKNKTNNQSIIYDEDTRENKCKKCNGCDKCISIKVDENKELYNGMIGTIVSFDNDYYKVCFSDKNNNVIAYFNKLYITNY